MSEAFSMLIDVRPGERLDLGNVRVEFVHKTGRCARLRVTAPREVSIKRHDASENSSARPCEVVPSTAA